MKMISTAYLSLFYPPLEKGGRGDFLSIVALSANPPLSSFFKGGKAIKTAIYKHKYLFFPAPKMVYRKTGHELYFA